MRITINLDDDLLATAARLTGITGRTPLIRESLKALIAFESARQLALRGGSQPDFEVPPSSPATGGWLTRHKRLGVAFDVRTH